MIRDPLYEKIIDRLNGDLDEQAFERCAQDLLRDAYPNLVPMVGGDDAGFDGAVGTSEGPFPLLCTIDQSGPLRNFRKNISTYLTKRNGPKLAVIATPRVVSNAKKRNLEDIAQKDYGVRIVNIHDQIDFANRLYRNAEWRRNLLDISGRPSALSALPPRSRPERPPLIGRDEDLAWLREKTGDLLLVGQPGIGKTYLHEALVGDGKALFAIDPDTERLADALRAQQPFIVIVDDVHTSIDLLRTLLRLRNELSHPFHIHANCWQRTVDRVRAELDLASENVRHLDPLTRDNVLALVKELGVHGPDELLHLLLNQAEGKPGLAAALVSAAKRGEMDRVWSGEAVAALLLHGRQLISNEHDRAVLAGISLGGNSGMTVDEIAEGLQITPLAVRDIVTNLAAGGVVEEVISQYRSANHRIAVRPEALRGLLVRDVFFNGPAPLPLAQLLTLVRNDRSRLPDVAHTLMAARQRGAHIPHEQLIELATEADNTEVWRHLAYVDETSARLILQEFPQHVLTAAGGLLRILPDTALPELLRAARSPHSEHNSKLAKERVTEWIEGEKPADPQSIARRRLLLRVLQEVGNKLDYPVAEVYDWALSTLVAPNIEKVRTLPGSGTQVEFCRGLRPLNQLREIAKLWPEVLGLCSKAQVLPTQLRDVIESWCLPGRHSLGALADETASFMKIIGQQMLVDISTIQACKRAGRSWVRKIARQARLDVAVHVDRQFDLLFNDRDTHKNWQTIRKRRKTVLHAFADKILLLAPKVAMGQLASLEREAIEFNWNGGWDRHIMYDQIAAKCSDPISWIQAAKESRLPAAQMRAFILPSARDDTNALTPVLKDMLNSDEYRHLARHVVLSMQQPTDELLNLALVDLKPVNQNWSHYLVHIQPSEKTMCRLLRHENDGIRVCAALAEWHIDPKGDVRKSLQAKWRQVILDAWQEDEHNLEQVLTADVTLAFDWANRKIEQASSDGHHQFWLWKIEKVFSEISKLFDPKQRWSLLEKITPTSYDDGVVDALMQGEPDLFRRWLRRHLVVDKERRNIALLPLRRDLDDVWEQFAIAALDEGVSSDELSNHVDGPIPMTSYGPRSTFYLNLVKKFERLACHEDERLRPVGRRGLEWTRAAAGREQQNEKLEAIRGR